MNSNDTPEVRTVTDQGARNVLQLVKLRYATVLAKLAVFGFLFGTGLGFAGDVREEALRRDFARYYLTTGEYVTQLDDCFAQTAARSDCAAQIPVWTQLAYDEARQKNTFVRFTARRQYRLEVALGLTLLSAGLIVWLFNFELRYVLRGDLHEQLTEDLITLGMILETVAAENPNSRLGYGGVLRRSRQALPPPEPADQTAPGVSRSPREFTRSPRTRTASQRAVVRLITSKTPHPLHIR